MSKYAKVGEMVRITTPKEFVRCGYPLTMEDIRVNCYTEIDAKVKELGMTLGKYSSEMIPTRVYNTLEKAVTYWLLEQKHFGGSERSVHERDCSFLLNRTGVVTKIRYVRTGTYYPGKAKSSWDGYEYEPAGLTNMKTHVIYSILVTDLCATYSVVANNCEVLNGTL
jgi:hypothetical protein